jgi:hypothetical protein
MILRKRGEKLEKEIEIGEKIRQIPNYQYRYAPIERCSDIQIDLNKGKIQKNTNMIVCEIRKIGKQTLEDYIEEILISEDTKEEEETQVQEIMSSLEEYLRESIIQMNSYHIWHLKINPYTIIIDKDSLVPIITDFSNASTTPYKKINTLDTTYYPIDYCLLTNTTAELLTGETSEIIFDNYWRNNLLFKKNNEIFTDNELIEFKEYYRRQIKPWIGKDIRKIQEKIKSEICTWDDYALSATFLVILRGTCLRQNLSLKEVLKKTILSQKIISNTIL